VVHMPSIHDVLKMVPVVLYNVESICPVGIRIFFKLIICTSHIVISGNRIEPEILSQNLLNQSPGPEKRVHILKPHSFSVFWFVLFPFSFGK
jgi:hypothetical protein